MSHAAWRARRHGSLAPPCCAQRGITGQREMVFVASASETVARRTARWRRQSIPSAKVSRRSDQSSIARSRRRHPTAPPRSPSEGGRHLAGSERASRAVSGVISADPKCGGRCNDRHGVQSMRMCESYDDGLGVLQSNEPLARGAAAMQHSRDRWRIVGAEKVEREPSLKRSAALG